MNSPQRANDVLGTSHQRCVPAGTFSSCPACSLIRAFDLDSYILQYPMNLLADNEDPDQAVHLRSLLSGPSLSTCLKTGFRMAWQIYG